MKIEGVLEQILEGRHNLYTSETRIKTIYGYILITIRQIGFKPVI